MPIRRLSDQPKGKKKNYGGLKLGARVGDEEK